MAVKNNVFDEFLAACEKVKRPNQALLDAVEFTKAQEFYELCGCKFYC